MQLFIEIGVVMTPDGRKLIITLDVEPSDTVEAVKAIIHDRVGIPPGSQRLIRWGKQLENGHTLADYYIQKDETLIVMYRMAGD